MQFTTSVQKMSMDIHIGFTKKENKAFGSTKLANLGSLVTLKIQEIMLLGFQVSLSELIFRCLVRFCNNKTFIGPKGEDDLPSAIVRGWKYAKEENSDKPKFVEASQGEIVLRDLN